MYYLNCFFIYSILGYIAEIIFGTVISADVKSGILYGPWTFIYGFASIIIILISEKCFKKLHMNRIVETIIVFLILLISLMTLEWVGGFLIEKIFGYSFWNYDKFKFSIGKYTCLEMGLIWSFISIFFIYVIRPLFDKFILKIPKWLTIVIGFFFILDVIVTFIKI